MSFGSGNIPRVSYFTVGLAVSLCSVRSLLGLLTAKVSYRQSRLSGPIHNHLKIVVEATLGLMSRGMSRQICSAPQGVLWLQ